MKDKQFNFSLFLSTLAQQVVAVMSAITASYRCSATEKPRLQFNCNRPLESQDLCTFWHVNCVIHS